MSSLDMTRSAGANAREQRADALPTVATVGTCPALDRVQAPVDELLTDFLEQRAKELQRMDPALETLGREIADFVGCGGKRLRPAFAYWGYRATGAEHNDGLYAPAAAIELLHNFALIHDDVMDRSASRRGRPTVHEALSAAHTREELLGDPAWFGVGAAVLAGDLAFVWADQLLDRASFAPDAIDRARRIFTELRVEVMAGQYLDLRMVGVPDATVEEALNVALLKSGRYTVTRPLQLGATLAGGSVELDEALATYGDAIGLAFQLRDDVLGLFGDPEMTGKSALSDLREGKRTPLILQTLTFCDSRQRGVVEMALGNRDLGEGEAAQVRDIVVKTGSLAFVERLVARQLEAALRVLNAVDPPARTALEELAQLALFRVV